MLLYIQQGDVRFAEHAQLQHVAETDGFTQKTLRKYFVDAGAGQAGVLQVRVRAPVDEGYLDLAAMGMAAQNQIDALSLQVE